MIKGLKKLGILALSAVIAMGAVTAVLPAKEVWAGEYAPVTGITNVERAEWRFADGIIKEGDIRFESGDILHEDSTNPSKKTGGHYHLVFDNAYEYPGADPKYDIHFDLIIRYYEQEDNDKITGTSADLKDRRSNKADKTKPAQYPSNGDFPVNDYISFAGQYGTNNKGIKYTIDLEIWLQNDENNVPSDEVPFIVGSVWNGKNELNDIYSTEKLFTNISDNFQYLDGTQTFFNRKKGFYNGEGNDNFNFQYKYLNGFGYEKVGDVSKVKLGYSQRDEGNLELRIGYRAYSILYKPAPGAKIDESTIPDIDMIPAPDELHPNYPEDEAGKVKPQPDNAITKFKILDLYHGENYNKKDHVTQITLSNGDVIKVGEEIKKEQIPLIPMNQNVEIEIYTIPLVKLNYYFENDQIPQQPEHEKEDGKPNLSEPYKKYFEGDEESKDPTKNGSLTPGVVIRGADGKDYKLVGWFEDEDLTKPYGFNEWLTADKDIYAKWVVVEPPKPGPDPEPTPDSPSDPGSTPAPTTVAPAAPAPLPAGTVRVSPKTGDTTIPPIYYVMSVAALAGIGFLVFRRRGKN